MKYTNEDFQLGITPLINNIGLKQNISTNQHKPHVCLHIPNVDILAKFFYHPWYFIQSETPYSTT